MKFNGWQRIGIVASVLWTLSAAIFERNDQTTLARAFHQSALQNCLPEFAKSCTDKANDIYSNMLALNSASLSNILFVAVWPVLFGWILAYLIVKIVKWVKAGF